MLAYEASRKPVVAALVERAMEVTDEELAQAPVLPWIRKAVKELGAEQRRQRVVAQTSESMTPFIRYGEVGDPPGVIYVWNGDHEWITTNNRGSAIQIKYGDWVWYPDTGGVWIDTVFVPNPQASFHQRVNVLRPATKLDYINSRKEHILKYNGDAPVIDLTGGGGSTPGTGGPPAHLAALGVTFGR